MYCANNSFRDWYINTLYASIFESGYFSGADRDARGLLWVDPSSDPRDPECLAWVTGWLDPPPAPTQITQVLTQTNYATLTNWGMAWRMLDDMA
jgi:hypothetical protein